jgi:heme A synthase
MPLPIEQIKTIRRWLGWISVASLLVMFLVAFIGHWRNPWHGLLRSEEFVVFASLVTSVTTFLGFLVTTVMTWRKERREGDHASVQLEKNKVELEKLRREIGDKNLAAQAKKNKMSKRTRVG